MPQVQYEVEWISELPMVPDSPQDADWDRATHSVETFKTKAEAVAFARTLLAGGKMPVGACTLSRQEYVVNADILEHEGRTIREWVDREDCELSDVDDCVESVEMEPVRSY